tara:strand:- start:1099 stop:1701 length:603 start_codon:yes stop_codon:yes gene_type:complete
MKHAYVINLKRRPDRLLHIQKECKKVGLEIKLIEAVDGKEVYPELEGKIIQGAYGCYDSHLKALKLIQETGEDGLILEDDNVFVHHYLDRVDTCFNELPKGWKLYFLGGSLLNDNAIEDYSDNLKRAKSVLCTNAYMVSKDAVDDLIKYVEKEKFKIDVIYTRYQQENECFIAYPELAYQIEGHSDIVNMETDNIHLKYG